MSLKPKVAAALNAQINAELNASYVYLSMAAWFDAKGLPGFAQWFRGHSAEETEHGMRIYDYLVRRDGDVALMGIDAPKADYASAQAVLEAALAHEKTVTGQINDLFELAQAERDFATQGMLQWFIEEQTEEEDLFRSVLDQVEAAGDNRWNLLLLDKEMAAGLGRDEGSEAEA